MKRLPVLLFVILLSAPGCAQTGRYLWLEGADPDRSIASEIAPPEGYTRTVVEKDSFADWLRHLPLKPAGSAVLLFDGTKKSRQDFHCAVIDIDTGNRDLQQCADAVLRLRAEYLYSIGKHDEITFHYTSGDESSFLRWASGVRPRVRDNNVSWHKRHEPDGSYSTFRNYLTNLFIYAGTLSISREMEKRKSIHDIQIGDAFVQGSGHAVIVLDMAEKQDYGEKIFLMAQSYMPAQDIHILINPNDTVLSPWYSIPEGDIVETPEWIFSTKDLHFFESGL